MFQGTVTFQARIIKGHGLKFSVFEFNPDESPGVEKVEIEGPTRPCQALRLSAVSLHLMYRVTAEVIEVIAIAHHRQLTSDRAR